MTNDEMAEMIAERNGSQRFCKNCDDCCQPYNSSDDCFKSAMEAMYWKEEQYKTAYVVTRSDLHYDEVEKVFFNKEKAEEYCKSYNEDENSYHRNITKIEVTL